MEDTSYKVSPGSGTAGGASARIEGVGIGAARGTRAGAGRIFFIVTDRLHIGHPVGWGAVM